MVVIPEELATLHDRGGVLGASGPTPAGGGLREISVASLRAIG